MKRTSAPYDDRNVRSRITSSFRRTGEQKQTLVFSKRGGTIGTKSLGVKRIWDSIAPPMRIKTMKFYPRQGNFEVDASQFIRAAVTPVLEAPAGSQRFDQFHMLTCSEWIHYSRKLTDNTILIRDNEESATPGSIPSLTEMNRNLMLESYKQTFHFENCQAWPCWMELIEVQPRRPIMDQVSKTGTASVGFITSYSDPLGMMYKDTNQNRAFSNVVLPRDTAYLDNQTQQQGRLGYTVNSKMRCFHRNYRVLKRKIVKIEPGGKVQYDVVIPGFKSYSNFQSEEVIIDSPGTFGGGQIVIAPSMWERSRTLLVRHWSDTVSSTGAANKLGLGDTRIKVICDKYVSLRQIPAVSRPTLYSEGADGVDAYGYMVADQDTINVTDAQVQFISPETNIRVVAPSSV